MLSHVLAHVESKVANLFREPLQRASDEVRTALQSHDARIAERLSRFDAQTAAHLADFRKNLENEIAAIVVTVLDEYKHELRKEYLDAGLLK